MKILLILIILSFYILLNAIIIFRNAREIDIIYDICAEELNWKTPKYIMFLVLLISAIFIFGFKRFKYISKQSIRESIRAIKYKGK